MEAVQDVRRRYIPPNEWPKFHSWPPPGGLRYLILHEHTNGFHSVVKRLGRRILIDEQAFFEWVERGGRDNAEKTKKPIASRVDGVSANRAVGHQQAVEQQRKAHLARGGK